MGDGSVQAALELASQLLGGLGIFYLGLKFFFESFQAVFGKLIQRTLNRVTAHGGVCFAAGGVTTLFIPSSSTTAVSTVGLVNAGLMNFSQAMYFMAGSSLAATVMAWIFAMNRAVSGLVFLALAIPFFAVLRREYIVEVARVLLGVGLFFVGLQVMTGSALQTKASPLFALWLQHFLAQPYAGPGLFAAGFALAVAVRSSAVVLAMALVLGASESVTGLQAFLLILGGNIGTALTPVRAAGRAGRAAQRVALAHFLFKAAATLPVGFFAAPVWQGLSVSAAGWPIGLRLALAHTLLNLLYGILLWPALPGLAWLTEKLLPNRPGKEPQRLIFLGSMATLAPSLAVEQGRQEVRKLAAMVRSILSFTKESLLLNPDEGAPFRGRVLKYEQITDNVRREVIEFLERVMKARLMSRQTTEIRSLLKICDELESIADFCREIVEHLERIPAADPLRASTPVRQMLQSLEDVIGRYDVFLSEFVGESEAPAPERSAEAADPFERYIQKLERSGERADDPASVRFYFILSGILMRISGINTCTENVIEAHHSRG